MLIDPPIDKLIEKSECRYALTCVVAKRARELLVQEKDKFGKDGVKPVSVAAQEVYEGKVKAERN